MGEPSKKIIIVILLETAIIHGGTNCDTLPDDDPNFKACDPDAVPNSAVNFMKVKIFDFFYYSYSYSMIKSDVLNVYYSNQLHGKLNRHNKNFVG